MTVKELIEKLKKFPEDSLVIIPSAGTSPAFDPLPAFKEKYSDFYPDELVHFTNVVLI